MLLKRFFERARTRSSTDAYKQACLCTAAKRDSLYDDPAVSLTKINDRQSADQYGFIRADKPRRLLMRQVSLNECDVEDKSTITEKLRRATPQSPANIPMLVVVSFNPDAKNPQKHQIEIQRGFPVNAQYIVNEWLFIKTADNEEGFVPYVCCRPMLRRQLIKSFGDAYKPYDFELNSRKSPSTNLGSSSYLPKKRHDITTSSCAGDSGVSDCETSSNKPLNFDFSRKRSTRLSNIRSLRSSSNTMKKTGLIVQDLPLKKSLKTNQIKSQLLISSNSAFTQIVKKNQRQESYPRKPKAEIAISSSSSFRRLYDSYDDTSNHYPISSPHIRRTPYARRSLPHHHIPSIEKKVSSPDPFRIIKEHKLRNIVLAEPSIPPALIPIQSNLQRHFSDLSLNQIENDSLSPSTPIVLTHHRPSLSCSFSSSSATSSTSDGHTTPFIHIQMSNYRAGRMPVVYASSNSNKNSKTPSNSFIHNVSITV